MVEMERIELSNSGCKPDSFPLAYIPGKNPKIRTLTNRFGVYRATINTRFLWWRGLDLHQRGQETADLQSADIATNRPLQMVWIGRLKLPHISTLGPKPNASINSAISTFWYLQVDLNH